MVSVLPVMYICIASSQGAANIDHYQSDFYCKNSIPMWSLTFKGPMPGFHSPTYATDELKLSVRYTYYYHSKNILFMCFANNFKCMYVGCSYMCWQLATTLRLQTYHLTTS